MLAVLVAAVLTQAPPPVPVPSAPPAPPAAAPRLEVPPPSTAPQGFTADFVDQHLLAVDFGLSGFRIRDSARTWTLGEGDGVEALFSLIPEAKELAAQAEHDFRIARVLQIGSLGLSLTALGVVVMFSAFATSAAFALPLLVGSLVACLVALVVSLVAAPFAVSAQEHALDAVSTFNHGLVRRLEGPKACPGVPMAYVPGSQVVVEVN